MQAKNNHFITTTALAVVSLLAISACTTVNPYTREEETSSAASGAAIGAAAGAAAAILTADDDADSREKRERILIGAGIGALAGGSVGYYMDVQEAKLRKQLEGTGVSVTRDGNNIILNMPGNVTFQTGSSQLNPAFHDVLNSVALVVKEYEKTMIEVAGHTDSVGGAAYNQGLSRQRAKSVATYFISQGINQQRILTVGYGESRPIASNDTETGRAKNRRVELTLIPITQD